MKEILTIGKHPLIENSRGGIYNSSIFQYEGKYYLIGRCESIPEDERSGHIFKEHCAILFELDSLFNIISYKKLKFETSEPIYRIEDFRVFNYKNKLYVNHTFIKILPTRIITQVISELDIIKGTLKPINCKFDISQNEVEKNWTFFEHNNKLMMIYSLSPYILLSSDDDFNFSKVFNESGLPPINDYYLSSSTNPIDLGNFYLSFYHFRDESKTYHQKPFLIDKETLMIKNTPTDFILSGGNAKGVRKNVLYLMSHIKSNDDIIMSFGEGDFVTTIKKTKISDILPSYTQISRVNVHQLSY